MVPFVIVADLRTGSTLLASSLMQHPQIRCRGELFHPEDLPDNRLDGLDRRRASAEEILRRAFAAGRYRARGFKAMIFLPLGEQWPDAWDRLRAVRGLRVIELSRRDRLAQYASLEVACRTGVFHPCDGDGLYAPENRPRVTIDPGALRAWVRERDALLRRRRRQLRGAPRLGIEYETLTTDWDASIARIQAFLGVDRQRLRQHKRKQERRPLPEVIANYEEVVAALPTT